MENKTESFVVTRLSRADFEAEGFDTESLTDNDMEHIASKMADTYVENMFWEGVRFHAEDRGLPQNLKIEGV